MEYSAFSIDKETLEKLRRLAETQERSMAAQVRFLVNKEHKRLFGRKEVGENTYKGKDDG
mgnify:CR=1 FL=1